MRNINEILSKIKELKGLKSDTDLAVFFNIKPQTVSTWKKRGTIPYDLIVALCEKEGWPLNWLLTGQITTKRIKLEDGREVMAAAEEPGLYKKEEKPLIAAEKTAIYETKGDRDLAEIIQYLQEHPEDKKLILKLLKGKKDIKEALEGFKIKGLLEGEG